MGSWWKAKLTRLSLPLSPSFPLFLSHSHSRKNPIIEISGPCWKCDSLWNVCGVTQRQCLSCRSANRKQCARRTPRDNGERERLRKEREPRRSGRERKKHLRCRDELMTSTQQQQHTYSTTRIVQEVEVYAPPPEGNAVSTVDIVPSLLLFLLLFLLLTVSCHFLSRSQWLCWTFRGWLAWHLRGW